MGDAAEELQRAAGRDPDPPQEEPVAGRLQLVVQRARRGPERQAEGGQIRPAGSPRRKAAGGAVKDAVQRGVLRVAAGRASAGARGALNATPYSSGKYCTPTISNDSTPAGVRNCTVSPSRALSSARARGEIQLIRPWHSRNAPWLALPAVQS